MNSTTQPGSTYFVTGCGGFIASRVSRLLLDSGHRVVGIDNLNDYYSPELKRHRLESLESDRFVFHEADIEDAQALAKIFDADKFDAVFNLAARAGVRYSMENPYVYLSTNSLGSLNLIDQMHRTGVSKFVLASTSSLYAGQPMPFQESLPVNTPISPYAASKKAAEVMAYSYHHLYKLDVSICRYFTVYGPAGRPDMSIFRFIRWIDEGTPIELFGDGEQSRDFTYVDDIARGTILAAKPVGYEIINLGGGGTPVSLNTLIAMLEERLGKKAKINYKPFHQADMMTTSADISKAKELLDWTPEVSLEEGLDASVDWYRQNQPWSQQIPLP
ncbi:NAD-dependent epimerase/dehydratase family protein [Rhodopirellula sp. MGV]|uniref:NAD-dependent epimerase/dehydratase family protein n=1 Tax=Rhodopirellula sp. MGV TaxID=2023130 RepID=UPI000B9747B5|nr:NAD-dependent epimerase/dehydratase family protein [Rhodopirellula sp. MGV]OYP39175.1 nucleotide sugar epimerase [Rhodopirellula sp. MGV]PNY35448.1 nucleotide sugar epimerase [Rhodopirellula baltica]